MTLTPPDHLDELIDRLSRAADQLRGGELSADAAATLVEDCAAVAAEVGAELERRGRIGPDDLTPLQERLL